MVTTDLADAANRLMDARAKTVELYRTLSRNTDLSAYDIIANELNALPPITERPGTASRWIHVIDWCIAGSEYHSMALRDLRAALRSFIDNAVLIAVQASALAAAQQTR